MTRTLVASGLLLICVAASADTVGVDDLPARLAAELASGAVQAQVANGAISSYASTDGFSAYAFERNGQAFALVKYEVQPGSQFDTLFTDPLAVAGQFFVEAPQQYFPGTNARFTLYFDQLTPGFFNALFRDSNGSDTNQATLALQPDAMADGVGVYHFSGKPDYQASGSMDFIDSFPNICIECLFDARFELIYLDYSGVFLDFDFNDSRSLIFTGFDTYDGPPYGWGLDIFVAASDIDGDGVADSLDNCAAIENADQIDADGDGIGNICDGDFNNDCFVNFADFREMTLGSDDPELDLDGSGSVTFLDVLVFRHLIFRPPGPGAAGNVCSD